MKQSGDILIKGILNAVIKVESDLDAFKVLKILQEIEENLGRKNPKMGRKMY